MVTAERAHRTSGVREFLAALDPPAEAHVAIAVWLMRARDHPPEALATWIDALPRHLDCTISWSERELEVLQASRARAQAAAMRAWASAEWARVFGGSAPRKPDFDISEERWRWALCATWSRSFHVQAACAEGAACGESDGMRRVLAPGADLLNHASSADAEGGKIGAANARVEVRADAGAPEPWQMTEEAEMAGADDGDGNAGGCAADGREGEGTGATAAARAPAWAAAAEGASGALLLRASRRIGPGEEALLDYGPRGNAQLLTTHGFAVAANAHESLPVALEPNSEKDELAPIKARILSAGNLSSPYELSRRALQTDSDVLVALRVIAASPSELKDYRLAFEGRPLSTANEARWRATLRAHVRALLREREATPYTSLAHDAALLASRDRPAGGAGSSAARAWMALLTRHSEKLMLADVLLLLAGAESETTAAADDSR